MPYKDRNQQLEAQRRHYAKNSDDYKNRRKARIRKIQYFLYRVKRRLKCSRCPESHFACLDFHHVDETAKVADIAELVNVRKFSIQRLKTELRKCIVLCANCHRKEHVSQRINW